MRCRAADTQLEQAGNETFSPVHREGLPRARANDAGLRLRLSGHNGKLAECVLDFRYGLGAFRDAMAFRQVFRIIVREPHLTIFVLPDQGLLREIDPGCLRAKHQGRTDFRITKDKQFGRA